MLPIRNAHKWQRYEQLCIVFVFEGNGKSLQNRKNHVK